MAIGGGSSIAGVVISPRSKAISLLSTAAPLLGPACRSVESTDARPGRTGNNSAEE